MNTPSPLIPQGATPPRGKSSLYFKVLMILTVHVVVIGGMLLQGCKDTSTKDQASKDNSGATAADMTSTSTSTTASTTPVSTGSPADVPPTLNPNISNTYAGAAATAAPATTPPPVTSVVPPAKATDLGPQGEAKEYVIAKGDTLAVIARRNGVSLNALKEANPNANPKKLQVGQKLQIPAGSAAMAASSTTGASATSTSDAAPAEGSLYVVKSGDTLMKIAKSHSTSFKKIMAMNDLKTTSIRAGQKLKMPASKASATELAPASASAAPETPARTSATPVSPVAAN